MDDLEGHWQPVRSTILAIAGLLILSLMQWLLANWLRFLLLLANI